MNENTFKNHRILVKRITDGKVVADTRIKRYEPVTNSFVISADSLTEKSYYQVTAMVFGEDDLYEFEGSIKGTVIENEVEISLGKRRKKEDRKRPRYRLSASGLVTEIYFEKHGIRLHKPMFFKTINMSSGGVLLRMDSGSFERGNRFKGVIPVEGRKLEFICEIVRTQNDNRLTEEYGCRIANLQYE